MPQKLLNIEHIGTSFQRMCGKAVTKHMHVAGPCNTSLFLVFSECNFHAGTLEITLFTRIWGNAVD